MMDFKLSNYSGEAARVQSRRSKLDCLKFDGCDFLGWGLKVEQYFLAMSLANEDRVQTAMINLEGRALQWHQHFMKSKGSLKEVS